MAGSGERDIPDLVQTQRKHLRADQVLYNDLIGRYKLVVYRNVQ